MKEQLLKQNINVNFFNILNQKDQNNSKKKRIIKKSLKKIQFPWGCNQQKDILEKGKRNQNSYASPNKINKDCSKSKSLKERIKQNQNEQTVEIKNNFIKNQKQNLKATQKFKKINLSKSCSHQEKNLQFQKQSLSSKQSQDDNNDQQKSTKIKSYIVQKKRKEKLCKLQIINHQLLKKQKINNNLQELNKKTQLIISRSPQKITKVLSQKKSPKKIKQKFKKDKKQFERKNKFNKTIKICDEIFRQVQNNEIDQIIGEAIRKQWLYQSLQGKKDNQTLSLEKAGQKLYQSKSVDKKKKLSDVKIQNNKLVSSSYDQQILHDDQSQNQLAKSQPEQKNHKCNSGSRKKYMKKYIKPKTQSSKSSSQQNIRIKNAITIQKNWRGYNTRKLLKEYFYQLYLENQNLEMQKLDKSQQYLYQQEKFHEIIDEDEREYIKSESNTHHSKIKKEQSQIQEKSKIIEDDELDNFSLKRTRQKSLNDDKNHGKLDEILLKSQEIEKHLSLHEKNNEQILYYESIMQSQETKQPQQFSKLDIMLNQIANFKQIFQSKTKDQIGSFLSDLITYIETLKNDQQISENQLEQIIKIPQTQRDKIRINIEIPLIKDLNNQDEKQLDNLQKSIMNQIISQSSQTSEKLEYQSAVFENFKYQNLNMLSEVGSQIQNSQLSQDFIGKNTFRQFATQILNNQEKRKELQQHIQSLKEDFKNQKHLIDQDIYSQNYKLKKDQLETWVTNEQKDLLQNVFQSNLIQNYSLSQVKKGFNLMCDLLGQVKQDLSQSLKEFKLDYQQSILLSKSNIVLITPKKQKPKRILDKIPIVLTSDDIFQNQKFEFEEEDEEQKDIQMITSQQKDQLSNIIFDDLIVDFLTEITLCERLNDKMQSTLFQKQSYLCQDLVQIDNRNLETYLDIFIAAIEKDFLYDMIENLNIPYDYDVYQKMRALKQYQNGTLNIRPQNIINKMIKNRIFQSLEKKQFQLDKNTYTLLECFQDSLGEEIDLYRPYENRGQAMPWVCNQKKLTYQNVNTKNIMLVLDRAKDKVIENSQFYCGLIQNKQNKYINLINEKRLNQLVIENYLQNEEQWTTYDDFISIIKFELSELIYQDLIKDTVQELQRNFQSY